MKVRVTYPLAVTAGITNETLCEERFLLIVLIWVEFKSASNVAPLYTISVKGL